MCIVHCAWKGGEGTSVWDVGSMWDLCGMGWDDDDDDDDYNMMIGFAEKARNVHDMHVGVLTSGGS